MMMKAELDTVNGEPVVRLFRHNMTRRASVDVKITEAQKRFIENNLGVIQ